MGTAVSTVYSKYATFQGRATRSEYWWYNLFIVLVYLFGGMAAAASDQQIFAFLTGLFIIGSVIPSIAVAVRRLHDTGRSGGWYFITFVPLIGFIWLAVLACLDSDADNEYGPRASGSSSVQASRPPEVQATHTTSPEKRGPFV